MPLAAAAELFASSTGRASSSKEYQGVLRSFVRFAAEQGVTRGEEVDLALVIRYQASLAQLAASTRHHRLLLLRQFLRFTEQAGISPKGLASGIRIQPLSSHHPEPAISVEQSLLLIAGAPDSRSELLVWLLLATGARISELLSCNLTSYQDGLLYVRGKTGSRAISLGAGIQKLLEAELAARAGEPPTSPLFRSRQGRLSDRRARELLAGCCERAGLPPLSPHQLRHAACARWLRAGIPVEVVSRTLGHSRPSTTLDHYASITAQDLQRGLAADPLDRLLEQMGHDAAAPIPGAHCWALGPTLRARDAGPATEAAEDHGGPATACFPGRGGSCGELRRVSDANCGNGQSDERRPAGAPSDAGDPVAPCTSGHHSN